MKPLIAALRGRAKVLRAAMRDDEGARGYDTAFADLIVDLTQALDELDQDKVERGAE